ncbi:hypothetical protein FALBO_4821 [Fusarium albosuccineum]|uniref:N,N-dimethylformamidase beta subunit-like C-terminal domain-containing protein n=1 Tax=Fusarium albosuccineum TaxID=1237068 RepID=A0A8H4LIH6_9HYPO|nr:hypothetical protein FALBO_4821 [Fusarium albosuccineum]
MASASTDSTGQRNDARVLGYPTPLSVRPGEDLSLHVTAPNERFNLKVIRFRGSPEVSPDAREAISAPGIEGEYNGTQQVHHAGSSVSVSSFPIIKTFALDLDVFPTLLDEEERGLVVWSAAEAGSLSVTQDAVVLRIGSQRARLEFRLKKRIWHHIRASYDARSGLSGIEVTWKILGENGNRTAQATLTPGCGFGGDLVFGAMAGPGGQGHFNGKLTGPTVTGPTGVVGDWGFGGDHGSDVVEEKVASRNGRAHNNPMRACHGPSWDGSEVDPRRVPDMHNAIHFLEDSLSDAGWSPSVTFTVPKTWRSGVYAAVIDDGQTSDEIPFYVKASPGSEAPLLFLAPTNTYIAYGNERTSFNENSDALNTMKDRPILPNDDDHWMKSHPELGMSVYDTHRDGSGCVYSTRLRPIMAFRAGYRSWLTDTQRHFASDLYLIDFLEREGIEYSVAIDEDLHTEGLGLLRPHKAVSTGSHPEYWTHEMLDALRDYTATRGRLAYLGGNGFYWVTSYSRGGTHTTEVRRGFTGDTNFTSVPGETYHSTTGEPGGIWRLRGRDPRFLVGIAFGAKGWARARPYHRVKTPPPGYDWVFEGCPKDAAIGDAGQVLDGAAGDELDCVDPKLGTPADTVVLAVADGFDNMYQPVIEDYTTFVADQGGSVNPRVRADMVAFETAHGGGVFSVGSICWIPCLPANNFKNHLATVTGNVFRRFISGKTIRD